MPILEVEKVSKYYGSGTNRITGCLDISFTAEAGGVYSLLGLNGAGKSTVLNSIAGYCRPSSGDIKINGYSITDRQVEAKRHIGMLYEHNPLYESLTVQEFLAFTLNMHNISTTYHQDYIDEVIAFAIDEVIAFADLQEVCRRRIKGLSKGYRQRVGFAQAIVHRPSLILLDEPASGLDPLQLNDFEKKIQKLSATAAVILSTHQLEQAARLCSRHFLVHKGQIIAQGTETELTEKLKADGLPLPEETGGAALLLHLFETYAGVEKRAFTQGGRQ